MSTKKVTTKTNENPERYLIEGAGILVNGFGTPGKFLSLLTNGLHWTSIEGVSEEIGSDRTFFIRLIITELLQRWISNDERINESIAVGLKEIQDWYGYEGYRDEIAIILKGLAISISKEGCPVNKYLDEYFKGVSIMLEVGDRIQSYEMKIREEKLSKAA